MKYLEGYTKFYQNEFIHHGNIYGELYLLLRIFSFES
jgi:hypothetical protein